jgi:restriction system protein
MLNLIKGWFGEKITTLGMWMRLDPLVYRRFDDVIVPAENGTTQVDHVLVSVFGIFVIETKNLKGWIFGSADSQQWTQSIFGRKYQFQNPLRQNYRHTKCLSDHLDLDHGLFHSVVFFIGECEFKTAMPPNVLTTGLGSYITSFGQPILSEKQVEAVVLALNELKQGGGIKKSEHLVSLQVRHESTTVCPHCGFALQLRVARKGANAGGQFFGCTAYPKCRYTRNV